MGQDQFPVARSPPNILVGLVFALAVVGVAPYYPTAGQEAFTISGAPNPPQCENINDTLVIYINVKKHQTLEKSPMR
jgi:hypothetical protein